MIGDLRTSRVQVSIHMADSTIPPRLDSVSNSQENIQSLSLYLLHKKKLHKSIVDQWLQAVARAKPSHRLTLLYLANDVIQNARKKGIKEYLESFQPALSQVMQLLLEPSIRKNVLRVLEIWTQRNIYPKDFIDSLKRQIPPDVTQKLPESALTTQIIAEFQLKTLINQIRQLEGVEKETAEKLDGLTNVRLNIVTSDILNQLKDKTIGDHLLKEADGVKKALETAIQGLEQEVEFRKGFVESLTKALIYYVVKQDEVDHEFKAYIKIGQNVASVMQEFNKSSILPPVDAPSPTDSDDGPILPSAPVPQTSSLDKRLETILHGIIQDGRRHAQSTSNQQQMVQSYESRAMNQPYDPGASYSDSPHDSSFVRPIPAVISARDSSQGHMSSHYDSFPPLESCEPSDMDITNSDDEEYSPSRIPPSSTLRVIEPHPYQPTNVQANSYSIQPQAIHHTQPQQQPSQYAPRGHQRDRQEWNARANNARSHPPPSGNSYNWRPHKGGRHGHGGRPQPRNDFRHH